MSNQREEGPPPGWFRDVRQFYEESLYNDRALAEWAENYGPLLFSCIEELEKENKRLREDDAKLDLLSRVEELEKENELLREDNAKLESTLWDERS